MSTGRLSNLSNGASAASASKQATGSAPLRPLLVAPSVGGGAAAAARAVGLGQTSTPIRTDAIAGASCTRGLVITGAAPSATAPLAPRGSGEAGGDGSPLRTVPRLMLQAWLGLEAADKLHVAEIEYGLRDTPGIKLLLAGTRFAAGARQHAALALLIVSEAQLTGSGTRSGAGVTATAPDTHAAALAQLAGSRLHWGSVRSQGARWQGPEPGWSTEPPDSIDGGGGAWQSAFRPVDTPLGPVHALLLQLPADDGMPPAIAAIVKAPANRWMGDAATRRDFYFDLAAFPESGALISEADAEAALKAEAEGGAAAAAVEPTAAGPKGAAAEAAAALSELLTLPQQLAPLDPLRLARAPAPRGAAAAAAAAAAAQEQRRAKALRSGAPKQPELPPPWAEGPPRDKTQVATLLGEQLTTAAVAHLTDWAARQEGLKAAGAPIIYEFQVEGFAAPLAAAATVLLPVEGGAAGAAEVDAEPALPVAAVCWVADEGLAGAPPGLVLHWAAAGEAPSLALAEELPAGWRTEPDVSWDVGRWCWATPFAHAKAGEGPAGAKLPTGSYHVVMAVPLQGVFGPTGRLIFELRTAKGQWLRNGETATSFLLPLEAAARAAGLAPPPPPPPPPASKDPPSAAAPSSPAGSANSVTKRSSENFTAAAKEQEGNEKEKEGEEEEEEDVTPLDAALLSELDAAFDIRSLLRPADAAETAPLFGPVAHEAVQAIASEEQRAERSLMHRFSIAADLLRRYCSALAADNGSGGGGAPAAAHALAAVALWLRFSSLRLLRWNNNYNIKPREISEALDGLGEELVKIFEAGPPSVRGVVLLALSAAGRGGQGDAGQRIRDEILAIQQRSGAKGGMMEQWHQKLHNNSSPDDIVICKALLAYIRSGLDEDAYWDTLAEGGVTRERLASFDRAITAAPSFTAAQAVSLEPDLLSYLDTLVAVHGGADLGSAAEAVMGYNREPVKGKAVSVDPVPGVASPPLAALLSHLARLQKAERPSTAAEEVDHTLDVVETALRARRLLTDPITGGNSVCGGRLKDVLFLDLALANTSRTALEASLQAVASEAHTTPLPRLLRMVVAAVESAALGPGGITAAGPGALRYELVLCVAQLRQLEASDDMTPRLRALQTLAVAERATRALAAAASATQSALQPTADALGAALGLTASGDAAATSAVEMLSEEEVRAGPAAALSNLLAVLQPRLLELAGAPGWQIISRGAAAATGPLLHVPSLATAAADLATAAAAGRPAPLLLVDRLKGEDDIPAGCGGVIVTGPSPDVLSHAAVRARASGVPLVACIDPREVERVAALAGRTVRLMLRGEEVEVLEADASFVTNNGTAATGPQESADSPLSAAAPSAAAAAAAAAAVGWCGQWLVGPRDFKQGVVGAKAANTARLAELLPPWLRRPVSSAVPFGAFERGVLTDPSNSAIAAELARLAAQLATTTTPEDAAPLLETARTAVQSLKPPPALMRELATATQDLAPAAGAQAVENVWGAALGVWASQWGAGAEAALRAAGLPREQLRMGVLLQPVALLTYAFVAHTRSPTTGSRNEVYVEIVKGLGETLVSGDHPGRALGGAVTRTTLEAALDGASALPKGMPAVPGLEALRGAVRVLSYPSKSHFLVAPGGPGAPAAGAVLIARSDSNAEDLPGCSGAGLFASHPTAALPLAPADYASDPLCRDEAAALHALWSAALAAVAAERALGGSGSGKDLEPQDVEGGIDADGNVWVLQSRAQA